MAREPEVHAANMADLFRLYEAGRIRPRVSARYPLEQAGETLQRLEDRKALGKLVITVD